jgi:meiotically up-regulated gene 157 (Mug157) protein
MNSRQWPFYVTGHGYGNPGRPVGLICSMFHPSDDATVFPYLAPANLFAVVTCARQRRWWN